MVPVCHDCRFHSSASEKLIVSLHKAMTTITTIHQRWEQLQRHKSQLVTAPPEAADTQGGKNTEKSKCASYQKKFCAMAKAKSKQSLTRACS